LSQLWPASRLVMIGKAGHALSEAGISAELIRTMDALNPTITE
jgi:proline iminopeptidase